MIANPITRWLALKLITSLYGRVATTRDADFIIAGIDNPYLFRWYVTPWRRWYDEKLPKEQRTRWQRFVATWPNVYLHCTVRDDDDRALHDHPWPSVSLCLDGHLAEVYRRGGVERFRDFHPGDIIWRGPWARHRLFLPEGSPYAWTLFVTGPRLREWGFWCPQGFRSWREFTAAGTTGDSSRIGKGCE
jgi:hypothetical protein